MKTYALFLALYFFLVCSSTGHIKNGYTDIEGARASLKSIQTLLKEKKDLPLLVKESMKNKRDNLIDYITYYEMTEIMIVQFRLVSPELFDEIDALKDAKQRNVDVYVKFVEAHLLPPDVAAITNIEQDENDPHTYRSVHGPNTVSVVVSINKKSLMLLGHELGHVAYQVQNLAEYMRYYNSHYGENYNRKSIGHNDKEASVKMAIEFVSRLLGE
jgi:hypothetical protein